MAKGSRTLVLGKYELGRKLGEGNFGKVKYAVHADTGEPFAIKILDRRLVQSLNLADQIKREIATLKLLKHPNVVRLHEVSGSKTKIYMVLEYINGGELFDKIEKKRRLSECEGRKLFQQLVDAISYCHDMGVYHRDLKPENILVDVKGNIKLSDFGLGALTQHLGNDGLLHTTCGSPNYIAPEVLLNKGYDGTGSDIWSCGVILYVILTGSLPFHDRNLAVLYQKILKGDARIPTSLSPGAQDILRRILDPNPSTRLDAAGIRAHDWFKQDYTPVIASNNDDEDLSLDYSACLLKMHDETEDSGTAPIHINAFELIGMSSSLDLSGLFEEEDLSEREIRFTSNHSSKQLFEKIEDIVTQMGLQVQTKHGKLKVMQQCESPKSPNISESLSATGQVFELSPCLYVVELRKSHGDSQLYRQISMYHFGSHDAVLGSAGAVFPDMALMAEAKAGLDDQANTLSINGSATCMQFGFQPKHEIPTHLLQAGCGYQHCFDPTNFSSAGADLFFPDLPPPDGAASVGSAAVFYDPAAHFDPLIQQPFGASGFVAAPGGSPCVAGLEEQLLDTPRVPHSKRNQWGMKHGGQKNEKQRRERLGKKFEDLKSLIPNSTKPYRASIVADTIEYINELLRTVDELKMLTEEKRRRKEIMARKTAGSGDLESSSLAVTPLVDAGGGGDRALFHGALRSSWIQRRSKEMFVDVRIVDDEVNIKLTRRKRTDCLLVVARVLDELHLDLLHLAGGNVGGSHVFMLNAKIHQGSSVYASAIAKKLIEAMDLGV